MMNFKLFLFVGLLVFVCIENAKSSPLPQEEVAEAKPASEEEASSAEIQDAIKELNEMLKSIEDLNKTLDEILEAAKKTVSEPEPEPEAEAEAEVVERK